MKTYIRNSYTPKIGDYCNALVIDKETNKQYLFDKDGVWSLITASTADFYTKEEVDGLVDDEAESRQTEDERIWDKISDIEMASDVVDVVGTFADLSTYDTVHLSDNDLIKVLQDETHGDAISYYRWSTVSSSFSYVGSEGPYYTQAQTDTLLDAKLDASDIDDYYDKTETDALLANKANVSDLASKQDTLTAGQNITITNNVISAAGSTYSAGTGLNLNGTTFSVDTNTVALKTDLPTSTSQLINDSGFVTNTANNLSNYYLKSETYTQGEVNSLIGGITVPTKTSDLTNDSGFITPTDYATASTGGTIKVGSGLSITNGVLSATGGGVAESVEWANVLNKPTNVSYWTNDAGYITSAALPTKTSDLTNDSGFITSAAVPTNVSQLTNDAGYITNSTSGLSNYYTKSETYTQSDVNSLINSIAVPTKTSDLINDGADGTSTYAETDDLANYVTLDTDQSITGTKTINSVLKIQNGQGTGSLWVGGNVNSNTVSNNQRHLARIAVPSYSDITLGATLLGYDSSGDSDMHVANKGSDVVSFGGMKKITNATSPMAIGFCVTDTRSATAAANKIYPLEMDASSARFNVRPNYNGTNLATVADLPTVPTATSDLTNDGSDGTSTYVEADELDPIATDGMAVLTYGTSTWQDFIDAYNDNRVVYCRASLNADPSVGDKTRLAPMSYVDSETPTQVQFSFLRSLSALSDAQQTAQVFIYTLFNDDSWTVSTRELGTKVVAGNHMSSSYSNGAITLHATTPEYFNLLSPTTFQQDRARSVIALCRVSTTNNTELNSWSGGTLRFHRVNGLSGVIEININMENQYAVSYSVNVSYLSNFEMLGQTANLDTTNGWRPCVFKYNGVWYGGIEIATANASMQYVSFEGVGNFNVFGLDYYKKSYTSGGTTYPAEVLNQEIYGSLTYNKWSHMYKTWYNPQMDLTSSITPASGVTINNGGKVMRIGNQVTVSMEITTTASIAAWGIVLSGLPIRNPASSVYFTALDVNNANTVQRMYLNADGTIRTRAALPAGVYNINFTYIAQ